MLFFKRLTSGRTFGWFVLAATLTATAMGCEKSLSLERALVTGQVSYQGVPVKEGTIRFVPVKETQGPAAGASIVDGSYTVKASGGVPCGTHRVEIIGVRTRSAGSGPWSPTTEMFGGRKQEYIPEQYNRKSTLEVKIDGGSQIVQNFELN
jgi:hypothetical protein